MHFSSVNTSFSQLVQIVILPDFVMIIPRYDLHFPFNIVNEMLQFVSLPYFGRDNKLLVLIEIAYFV